ncbi:MAG TPA: aldo/keto reductase [Caulobacteraceae bacterium]|jgi:aryl-alcohol dehydrogenase-like predicted oxidoreductase|nr:aldo/keto reductase [Caulobacteraceae bacterium]
MRYRPFARTGMAVSALSLKLNGENDERQARDWRELLHAAFEEGVNAFELVQPSHALLRGFAEGASSVKRSLLFVALRLNSGLEGQGVVDWVDEMMEEAGLEEVNLLNVDIADTATISVTAAMRWMKDEHMAHRLGAFGAGEALTEPVEMGQFDAVVAPFNLLSGWRERNMVRRALETQMGVIACDPCPPALMHRAEDAKAQSKGGWFKKVEALAGAGSYAFLKSTPNWTAEQICLGYALTEPAVASVQVEVSGPKHLASLAEVTDRGLPSAVSAQIEMARFSTEREAASRRRA